MIKPLLEIKTVLYGTKFSINNLFTGQLLDYLSGFVTGQQAVVFLGFEIGFVKPVALINYDLGTLYVLESIIVFLKTDFLGCSWSILAFINHTGKKKRE